MNNTKLTHLAVFTLMAVVGCTQDNLLDSDLSEADAALNMDKTEIRVEGASYVEGESIIDTLWVRSNRSWSLEAEENASWFTISRNSGINLGKVTKEWPVVFTFEENLNPQERTANVHLTIDGETVTVPVIQGKFIPVLEIESEYDYELPETGGEIEIEVVCNNNWTATVDGESTAEVILSAAEGYKSNCLYIEVSATYDAKTDKSAKVILSAPGSEDVEIHITQAKCLPYFMLDEELNNPEVSLAAVKHEIFIDTNVPWTATLPSDTPDRIKLYLNDQATGQASVKGTPEDKLFIEFPEATFDTGHATVKFITRSNTGSELTDEMTFTRDACLFIPFRKWPDNNGWSSHATYLTGVSTNKYDIPRTVANSNDYLAKEENNHAYTGTDASGFSYYFFAGTEDAMFRSEACGLVIGSITQNPAFFIRFPAVRGKSLKKVMVMLGNSDTKINNSDVSANGNSGYIVDPSNNVVAGGEKKEANKYQKADDWVWNGVDKYVQASFDTEFLYHSESILEFELTGSEPNISYRYMGDYRQVIRWFILYYE